MERYCIFSNDSSALLGIISIGTASSMTATRYGPGVRSHCIIHYVISGKGSFNGTHLGAGEGFLIYPGDREEYHADPSDPWEFLWIVADGEMFSCLMDTCGADKATGVFSYDFIPEVKTLAKRLRLEGNSVFSAVECAELVCALMKHHSLPDKRSRVSASRDYASIAGAHIRMNCSSGVYIGELCEMLGISQPYLYKVFKAEYGVSPRQYITRLRITEAERMLSDGRLTVSEIAHAVGFDDVLTFSKFFSKHTGISPSKYRHNSTKNARDTL